MNDAIVTTFHRAIEASWQAALIALLVMAVSLLAGHRLAPRWRAMLWLLVFIRLAMPILPASQLSIFNLAHPAAKQPAPSSDAVVTFGASSPAPDISHVFEKPVISRPTADTVTAAPKVVWPNFIAIIWLAGAMVLIARRLIVATVFRRRLRQERRRAPSRVAHGFPLIETSLVKTPALCGVVRPMILLPVGALQNLTSRELDLVIAHESAHNRRRDLLIFTFADLMNAIHWFNPFAWLASRKLRSECEMACDDVVLTAMEPASHKFYGETILRILELFPSNRIPVGAQMVGAKRPLRRRLRCIVVRRTNWPLLGPALIAVIAATMLTTASIKTAAASDDTETRVYDVRDLLIDVPSFADFGMNALPVTSQPHADSGPPIRTHKQAVDDLITSITSSIDPFSWLSNTGSIGSIRESKGQLFITQTPANLQAIQLMFQKMRAGRSVQITSEARFLRGKAAEQWLENSGEHWTPLPDNGAKLWPHFLNAAQARSLIAACVRDKNCTLITAPRLTLFNGQCAFVKVTQNAAYLADFTPAGENFNPVIKVIESGFFFQCKTQASNDGRLITLTANPQLIKLLDFSKEKWPGSPANRNDLIVQKPNLDESRLSATITMPNDQTAVYMLHRTVSRATTQPIPEGPVIVLLHATIVKEHANESAARNPST